MKKFKILKVGDIISYRLEYLKRGGDFVSIDSFSRRRLTKRFYLLSECDFVFSMRLSMVCNCVRTSTLLRFSYDSSSCK